MGRIAPRSVAPLKRSVNTVSCPSEDGYGYPVLHRVIGYSARLRSVLTVWSRFRIFAVPNVISDLLSLPTYLPAYLLYYVA
jgi:hypothetical protein